MAGEVFQLVDKHNLYPPAPPLTRYKETAFSSAKKKLVESVVLDNAVNKKLDALTTSKLCVRMNTLQVVVMSRRWKYVILRNMILKAFVELPEISQLENRSCCYLEKIFPVLADGVPRKLAIIGSTLFLSFVNYTGLTIVGYVGVALGVISLAPFMLMSRDTFK
ncbi:hypothetical protein K7X08_023257 [Anisodus acutangulus]|uniref:PATROL1-like C-terminal domain-containing protein n=1 Tax=Anisodus acutangulus TaxID=402998 RepID=A0A9Q1LEI4_9SOLA|nr:hypothetical protein K7X08_023257 [Anisodus acutangulus]